MDIRSLCAAAVIAVGIGQAADAATVNYETRSVKIKLIENYVYCGEYECSEPQPDGLSDFLGLLPGKTVRGDFIYTIVGQYLDVILETKAGGVFQERLTRDNDGSYSFQWYDSSTQLFEEIDVSSLSGLLSGTYTSNSLLGYEWEQYHELVFTEIAPVPLPAAASLLPVGIGAFAMLRRRRRS